MKVQMKLDEMNILEMVDYFMAQGMTDEQASDLAHAEWQARAAAAQGVKKISIEEEVI